MFESDRYNIKIDLVDCVVGGTVATLPWHFVGVPGRRGYWARYPFGIPESDG